MTAGIVLAGGRSSRFGSDKLVVPLADGRPLLAHAVAPLVAVCTTVVVVVGHDGTTPDGLPNGLLIVPDPEAFGGPMVGLLAGLEALGLPADAVVLIAGGDMPSMDPGVLGLLGAALLADPGFDCARLEIESPINAGSRAVLPCAVRSGPALAAAHEALDESDRRLRGLLERLPTIVVPAAIWLDLDPGAATLRDIDLTADVPNGDRPLREPGP